MDIVSPPVSEHELIQRVNALSGLTLAQLAGLHELTVPKSLNRVKGWIGQLLERALGTDAGTASIPDFTGLNIELKTIPVDRLGNPQESTYVTVVPLLGAPGLCWQSSGVRLKLAKVLWIPIEAGADKAIADRRVGQGFIWSMDAIAEAALRADWEELMDYVLMGQLEQVSGSIGQYLHIRPKAAHSKVLTWGIGPEGGKVQTLPRGFYLRAQFTKSLIQQALSKKYPD